MDGCQKGTLVGNHFFWYWHEGFQNFVVPWKIHILSQQLILSTEASQQGALNCVCVRGNIDSVTICKLRCNIEFKIRFNFPTIFK